MRKREPRIKQVSYGRTVNVQNYESVRFDLVAEVAADEDWEEVFEQLRLEGLRLEKGLKKDRY